MMRQRTARRRRRRRRAQHHQLAHEIRRRQMANQHFQQQQDHQYNQDEEREQEAQQDQDRHNHTLHGSPTFYDLFAEVMNERLLEMYNWETSSPQNQQEQDLLLELESTAAMERSALVQDDAEQSPQIHTFESSEEGEQQKKKPMPEECDQTTLTNIQNNATLDSELFSIDQMEKSQ